MVSKNTVKFIKSLHRKKFRKQEQSFFVEGAKNVTELLQANFTVTKLLYTEKFEKEHKTLLDRFEGDKVLVNQDVLHRVGTFQTNDAALAVARMPESQDVEIGKGDLVLALDDVRDPGNLGTIIRVADWYGINKLIISPESADFFNPKVLNASMGSFCRVRFVYTPLDVILAKINLPVYGAFLNGDNLHNHALGEEGVIVVGNESKGISGDLEPFIHHKISIPQFGGAESLNVGIATAVICDNFMRKKNQNTFTQ